MKKLFSILLLLALVLTCVFSAIACKKDNGGNDDGGDNPPPVVTPINPDEYLNDSRLPSYKTYGDIVLDGELSEGEWDKFNALETEISLGGVPHDVYWSSSFADEGLIFAIKVEGSPVYYNINRGMTSNSGIEIYIAAGGTTEMMMNAWQMEIMPNGNYQTHIWHSFGDHTGYRMANANLDVKGSVLGAPLNSPDSTGYIIECMVPWEHFGYHGDTKPQYINMDTALLYCPTFNGERQAWVSMRQTFGPTYAWTNPSSWYSLTEFGFYDEDGDLLYVINDNKEVENGSVVVEGTFKEGGSVTVTPDDGYVLKSLYINGVKTDSLYYNVSPMTDRVLYIDAEFKPISGNPIEFNVLSKYHYTDAVPFGANVSFALENADGEIFAGVTDEDGKAVVYIPDGEYTIKMMGNSNGTIVIDSQSATTYDITLIKNGLSGIGSGATASNLDGADGVTIIGDESKSLRKLTGFGSTSSVDFTGKVILDYVYEVDATFKTCTFIRWVATNGNFYNNQVAWANNVLTLKQFETVAKDIPGSGVISAHIVYVIDRDVVKCYLKTDSGYQYLYSNVGNGNVTGFYLESVENEGYFAYKNMKVLDGVFAENYEKAILSASSVGETTVEFNKESAGLGDKIVATITPKEAQEGKNIVTSVKLNGQDVDYVANVDGTLTIEFIHNGNISAYDITVTTTNVIPVSVDFAVVESTIGGEFVTMANKDVTIAGVIAYEGTTDSDGNISVELVDGTYVINVDGYLPSTFVVADGQVANDVVYIAKNIFASGEGFEYGFSTEDGYWFTSSTHPSELLFIDNKVSDGDIIQFTYTGKVKAGYNHFIEFQFFNGANYAGNAVQVQFSQWQGSLNYKDVITAGASTIVRDKDVYTAQFNLLLIDNSVKLYFGDGTYFGSTSGIKGGSFGSFSSFKVHYETDQPQDGAWKLTNFKILRQASVDTEIVSENADVTIKAANGNTLTAVPFGAPVKIYATPTAGNYIQAIKLNGVALPLAVDGEQIYANYTHGNFNDVVIEVITTDQLIVRKTVTFDVTHKFAYGTASAIKDGTSIKFKAGENAAEGIVEGGKCIISLVAGEYTISTEGHKDIAFVVDNDTAATSNLVFLRKVLTHYGDYSDKIVDDGTNDTNGATADFGNDANFKFIKQYYYVGESVDFNQANIVEYEISMDTSAQVFSGFFFRAGDKFATDGFYTYFNQGCWQSNVIWLRQQDKGDTAYTANSSNANMSGSVLTVKVVIVSDGTTIKYYVVEKSGNVVLAHTSAKEHTYTHAMFKVDDHSGYLKWDNIRVFDGADVATRLAELGIN